MAVGKGSMARASKAADHTSAGNEGGRRGKGRGSSSGDGKESTNSENNYSKKNNGI